MSVRKYSQYLSHIKEHSINTEFPSVDVPVFLVKSGDNFFAAEYGSDGEIIKYDLNFIKVDESSGVLFAVGLEIVGSYLYFFNSVWWGDQFRKIDLDLTSDSAVSCIQAIIDEIANINDIYHDSGYWYIVMSDGTIEKCNMGSGGEIQSIVETIDISATVSSTIVNIRKEGDYWYVVSSSGAGGKTAIVYKFDLDWEYTGESFDLSEDLDSNEYLGMIASG